ncbi:TetR family transcriptional regulator [Leucobacter sp. UT-8R-CII-1-4]|uniref:TetR/AcrR family transcriptional regulator n=1 Tax=Leucobacter sp. UT-8R-CII-1-4 TaxID=3040075 RepID=UPI0024A844C7|nr:TetR family transcriptional regulator [Leucobacter sp. UT-8R-CII-1-4]MDI6023426.1 TetR family transcriptional regulator [Leucobacter sp. UT-8R-CII-1-4]
MGRKLGRSAEDTRRAILEAAAQEIRETGVQASIDQIAQRAGVSKGGLKYHFASKNDLLRALAENLLEGFRAAVVERAAGNTATGSFTRAYVSARLFPDPEDVLARQDLVLIAMLSTLPNIEELAHEDAVWWDEALANDGLPPSVYEVAMAAADGAACASALGSNGGEDALRRLSKHLETLIDAAQH